MQNHGGPLTPRKRFGARQGGGGWPGHTGKRFGARPAIGYRGSLHGMDGDSCR